MANKDWQYTGFNIADYKLVIAFVIALAFMIPMAIQVSNGYTDIRATILTGDQIELMDGKYVMSEEYLLSETANYNQVSKYNDVGGEYITWVDYDDLARDTISSVYAYCFENQTTYQIVPDLTNSPISNIRTDGNNIIYIWNPDELVVHDTRPYLMSYSGQDYGDLDLFANKVLGGCSVYGDIIAYSNIYDDGGFGLYMNRSVRIYSIDEGEYTTIWEGDGIDDTYGYTSPDIQGNLVVCADYNTIMSIGTEWNYLHWYNITTGTYDKTPEYDHLAGTSQIYSNPVVWGNKIVCTYYMLDSDLRPPVEYTQLRYIDTTQSNETIALKEEFYGDYGSADISQDFVVYEVFDDDIGQWLVSGTDLTDINTEFNISHNTENQDYGFNQSFDPHVWIGDDGKGYIPYNKYNENTEAYGIYFRYLNDTTVVVEGGIPEGNGEIDIQTQEVYNTDRLFIAMISISVGIAGVLMWYNFKDELGSVFEWW